MTAKTIVTALVLLYSMVGVAQECGTDEIHEKMLESDSAYANFYAREKLNWERYVKDPENDLIVPTANGPLYEIPVVVHVIHCGDSLGSVFNPTDTQIMDWIADCNAAYAAEGDYADTNNGGVNISLKLVLAKRSPSCGPTNGIMRFDGSNLPHYKTLGVQYFGYGGTSDTDIKSISHWPNRDYYNIYITRFIDGPNGTVAGYAYYPGAQDLLDGTVVASKYVTFKQNGKYWSILNHEIGHAFGLKHTFEGQVGVSCPPNSDCTTEGDGICDTEPHKKPTGCPSGLNTCTGLTYNNVQYNIMNYSDCPDRFTEGQRTKILYTLFNNRSRLLTSMGTTPPEQDSTYVTAACIPPPVSPNALDIGPHKIKLANILLNSEGYTLDGSAYLDWTTRCSEISTANLFTVYSQTIEVTVGHNIENVMGWIDFNNDGIFQESEEVLNKNGTVANQTFSQKIIPPADVVTCTPLRARVMSDLSNSPVPQPCSGSQYGQTEDFSVIYRPVPIPYAVTVTSSKDTICQGDSVDFTAQVTGGVPLKYSWQMNGLETGVTTSTYTSSALNSSDTISCLITHTAPCGLGVIGSNKIVIQVWDTTAPSVTITADSGLTLSPGQAVQFSAGATNIGSNPIFQWRRNGVDISGANADIYQATAGTDVQHDDELSLYVKNTNTCAQPDSAISNVLKLSVIEPTSIAGTNKMQPVLLFPNPNNGTFHISAKGMGEDNSTLQLGIYDIMGKEVFEEDIELISGNLDHRIQLSGKLPAGTYRLKVSDSQGIIQNIFVISE